MLNCGQIQSNSEMPEKDMLTIIAQVMNRELGTADAEKLRLWLMEHDTHQHFFQDIQVIWDSKGQAPQFNSQTAFQTFKEKIQSK